MGILEPTQILTPDIATSTPSSRKESNESPTLERTDIDVCVDEHKDPSGNSYPNTQSLNGNSSSSNVLSPEVTERGMEHSSSSTDIFSQIGSLVQSTHTSIDKQLSSDNLNIKDNGMGIETPMSPQKRHNSLKKSEEASSIISAFPLLDFMRSPVLMFPDRLDSYKCKEIPFGNDTRDNVSSHQMKPTGDFSSIFASDDAGTNNIKSHGRNINDNAIKTNTQR